MRYDWRESVDRPEFSRPWFEEIDSRFFGEIRKVAPWCRMPFDDLIPFEDLKTKSVLEIGVGMGSHAQLLASHVGSYVGIDLTTYAVKATSMRLKAFNLPGQVVQMDAERMSFPDASFDFVWSWGVIHHSSNTQAILHEMRRVLRPGGRAVVMVYHRGWWNYYVVGGMLLGLLRGSLFQTRSLHKTVQQATDGALARYFTGGSWREFVREDFRVNWTCVRGNKADVFPLPSGRFKRALMSMTPDAMSRFFTNRCWMGSFLIANMTRN